MDDDDIFGEEEDVSGERIIVMIFEYEIAEKSMDIKYILLTTRCLEYSHRNPPDEEECRRYFSTLTGSYII